MSRRHAAKIRPILPDVKYNSVIITKFINSIMQSGKKFLAENIIFESFDYIREKNNLDPFEVFNKALQNVKPFLELTSVRVGGANYQVPTPVDERRGIALATRWIIVAAKKRSRKKMSINLAEEFFDASEGKGAAIKKREETHKMAEANWAFAHYSPRKSRST
jgi:small subunit ribosomal protein S7